VGFERRTSTLRHVRAHHEGSHALPSLRVLAVRQPIAERLMFLGLDGFSPARRSKASRRAS